ncbi:unnamed protein product [Cyprideis torosa]|uniref:Uncharacterized protein n=1 Tax=Cyprideis torosa TaxID=163714 RepID=A0A7R8ZJJ6_9CRUS|nr:unnamed protein product [Cyprideis torosa]CAG0887146.1 unnamed protein product [Cyprideis torosa]
MITNDQDFQNQNENSGAHAQLDPPCTCAVYQIDESDNSYITIPDFLVSDPVYLDGAHAQLDPPCTCAVYQIDESDNSFITIPDFLVSDPVYLESCQDNAACQAYCDAQFYSGLNNLDLFEYSEVFNDYLGDYLCSQIPFDVLSHKLGVFVKICNYDFVFTGLESEKLFCCRAGLFLYDAC